jgi:hypothetical protein
LPSCQNEHATKAPFSFAAAADDAFTNEIARAIVLTLDEDEHEEN